MKFLLALKLFKRTRQKIFCRYAEKRVLRTERGKWGRRSVNQSGNWLSLSSKDSRVMRIGLRSEEAGVEQEVGGTRGRQRNSSSSGRSQHGLFAGGRRLLQKQRHKTSDPLLHRSFSSFYLLLHVVALILLTGTADRSAAHLSPHCHRPPVRPSSYQQTSFLLSFQSDR